MNMEGLNTKIAEPDMAAFGAFSGDVLGHSIRGRR
jgi:hypothetical protein